MDGSQSGIRPQKVFVSARAFRHGALRLIRPGSSIDQAQSALVNVRAQSTKEIYAPDPTTGGANSGPRIIDRTDIHAIAAQSAASPSNQSPTQRHSRGGGKGCAGGIDSKVRSRGLAFRCSCAAEVRARTSRS